MVGRCLALATLVALVGLGAQGMQFHAAQGHEALAERGGLASEATQHLTPEERKFAHEQAFEKEFTVELDMTTAREKDLHIGVDLDTDTDFTPVSVSKIRKSGLLELWNRAHPDDAVLLGDTITKVNDILWHHNSKTFVERIKGQFKASKKGLEGTSDLLKLFIQRPRRKNEGRTQAQRDDLYRKQYPKDFSVDIPFVPNQSMGWVLNSTADDWVPPVIESVSSTGMLALFNQEHPEFRIYPGDEIIMANNVTWHHNTKAFNHRIDTMLRRAVSQSNSKVAITLRIQRPRSVIQALEGKTFQKMFDVTLPSIHPEEIGWTLQTNTSDPINITEIRDGSFLSKWNKQTPEPNLAVGDRIVKANSLNWHHDKIGFASNLLKILSKRNSTTLRVQRQAHFNYARGWAVEIPSGVNQLLGIQLNASDDEFPVTINMVRRLTAAGIFNEDNPDDVMIPGDQIFKVNDILWRGNSREFAQSLEQEFAKSKRTGVMRLWLQRPEGLQREDDSSLDYLEFSTELNVSLSQAMGWELNTTGAGPVTVSKLTNLGSIQSWNDNNPLKDIQVGDQLIQVEDRVWHNNTEEFMKHLGHQLTDATSSKGKGSIAVLFRRPYVANADDVAEGKDEELGGDVMGAEE